MAGALLVGGLLVHVIATAGVHQSGPTPVDEDERAELKRLREENRELRMQRDFLKKAAAFFAKESK